MKKMLLLTAIFALSLLSAAPVAAEMKAKNWYRPAAKNSTMKLLPSGELEFNRLPKTGYGDLSCSQKIEIKPGEKIVLTFVAKGDGRIEAGVRVDAIGNRTRIVTLKPEFAEYKVEIDLTKEQAKLPQKAEMKFILSGKSYCMTLKSCKAEVLPAK